MARIATHRLDLGEHYKDYSHEELQDPAVMFVAIHAGKYIPPAFDDHYELLGCESITDEEYIRACVRVVDPYQRTLLALQVPVLDKQQILGGQHV